jgi:HEPN domain-containing protein
MVSKDCLEWLRFARMDITAAQDLYSKQQNPRHRPIEIILYHCQQGAEKALKAFIIQHVLSIEDLKTHDMQLLRKTCAEWDAIFNKPRITKHCALLDPFSVTIRYPTHNFPLDSALALRGLNSAQRIYTFVCRCLKLDSKNLKITR